MSRKSRAKNLVRLDELKLRVMAEYASSGIWVIGGVGPFRHGGISHSSLGLPEDLAQRFEQWIALYWGRLDYPEFQHLGFDADEFNSIGRSLAKNLKAYVGPNGYVEFIPELQTGGMGEAEVIE